MIKDCKRLLQCPSKNSGNRGQKAKVGGKMIEVKKCFFMWPNRRHTNTWKPFLWQGWRQRRVSSGIWVVPHELNICVHHFLNKLLYKYTQKPINGAHFESTSSELLWFLHKRSPRTSHVFSSLAPYRLWNCLPADSPIKTKRKWDRSTKGMKQKKVEGVV